MKTGDGDETGKEFRSFSFPMRSLTELKEWLLELDITHVAMESTGVYWKPVMNALDPGGFTILIVNIRHIKYKNPQTNSEWIFSIRKVHKDAHILRSFLAGT